jgi:probable F420-dependent oxidoreductase
MKFGLIYNTAYHGVDPDAIVAFARLAEEYGFESLFVPEHVALQRGSSLGSVEVDPSVPIADPLQMLGLMAAVTERILLGTAVIQLPHHHPVVLAKQVATLDVLSGGRLRLLTVGLGSMPGEAAAVGVDYSTRGRRADEAIDALRLLWEGDESGVTFEGEFFSFRDLCSFPKPHGGGGIPIHVSGSSRAAARRAGLRGDGYFNGGMLPPHERAEQVALMRRTATEAGRDPAALEYTRWGSIEMSPENVERRTAEGVTRLVLSSQAASPPEARQELSAFAERFHLSRPGDRLQ